MRLTHSPSLCSDLLRLPVGDLNPSSPPRQKDQKQKFRQEETKRGEKCFYKARDRAGPAAVFCFCFLFCFVFCFFCQKGMKFLVRVAAELAPYVFAGGLAYLSLRNQKRGAGSFLAKLLCVAPLAILVYLKFFLVRVQFPDNLIGNDFFVDPEFLDERTVRSLLHLTRRNTLPSNNRDTQFYARHVDHEHIGEATPLSPHGDCSQHALLIPDTTNTSCVLPSRVDVARHFLTTGGVGGRKELVETGISRLLSFGRYMFNVSDYPEAQRLFESPKFQAAASRMCPDDQQFLDPVQFNFIVQVPGQSVVSHIFFVC